MLHTFGQNNRKTILFNGVYYISDNDLVALIAL